MKSLDEVIKKIEKQWVCPSSDEADEYCELYDVRDDVLHYLKEYRDDRENFSEAISNCGKALNKYIMDIHTLAQQEENLPLTWDELRTMEGKPVWVEVLSDEIDLSSRWMLVARETKAHSLPLAYTDDIGHWIFGHEDKLGKTWQAYRKERE